MKHPSIRTIIPLLLTMILLSSCKKYLDKKPNNNLSVIGSVSDLQSLLDDYYQTNYYSNTYIPEASADDYYLTDDILDAIGPDERNTYLWAEKDLYPPFGSNGWELLYSTVYKSNTVLANMDKVERIPGDQETWNTVKGHALILRAKCFAQAVTIWAQAYDPATAATDLGLPLRLDPDFSKISVRSSVEETYARVVADCKEAAMLLPVTPLHITRPSRGAAYGLLARTYLYMRQYDSAARYATLCLADKDVLLDYNEVDSTATYPFGPQFSNPEIIWNLTMYGPPTALYKPYSNIDSMLYRSYEPNDLRKSCYFGTRSDGSVYYKGSNQGEHTLFFGPACDEVLLIRAECSARTGNTATAMTDLNRLLLNRHKTGSFTALTASNADDALNYILQERRKELVMRGLRWMDLKRLNKEGRNITIKRFVNNTTITLLPNSNRYVFPIPEDVILISGMAQNPR